MIQTLFYRTTFPVSQEYLDAFLTCHQEHFKGNLLSIRKNVENTECIIKCCGEMDIPSGMFVSNTYTLEQVKAVLQTPQWQHSLPGA